MRLARNRVTHGVLYGRGRFGQPKSLILDLRCDVPNLELLRHPSASSRQDRSGFREFVEHQVAVHHIEPRRQGPNVDVVRRHHARQRDEMLLQQRHFDLGQPPLQRDVVSLLQE